jgi:hypothetical protein
MLSGKGGTRVLFGGSKREICPKYLIFALYVFEYKTNAQIAKELKITPILDKLLEYKRNWIQHVNKMPRN